MSQVSAAPPAPPREVRTTRQRMLKLTGPARVAALHTYLQKKLRVWLNLSPEALELYPISSIGDRLGEDWVFLDDVLKKDLGLALYPNELCEMDSLSAFSIYLAVELEPPAMIECEPSGDAEAGWHWDRSVLTPEKRNPSACFLLSVPRSGSTLMRVILAGHPEVFAPPELHLLPFDSMGSRDRQLREKGYHFLGLGLEQTLSARPGWSPEESAAKIQDWVESDLPISSVYGMLQQEVQKKLLVDKTPFYPASVEWMARAEDLFENPRYIFLVRHPYSMIESFLRMRFHRMIGKNCGIWDNDPYLHSAKVWDRWNRNIANFLEKIDAGRQHFIRYEDSITEPEKCMTALCQSLGLPYAPAMIDPYSENRMTHGSSKEVFTVGDPNFLRRNKLDPSLANWQHIQMPRSVKKIVGELAERLGYNLP